MDLHAASGSMWARTACVCPRCDRGLDVAERSPWVSRVWHVLCDECEAAIAPTPACGNCGKPGAPVATFGGDVFCHACMHALLVEDLEHAADTVQRSDATMICDLVRSLHGACRDCESTFAKGWRDGLTHALGIVLDEDARLAYAWREAIRLGPAVSAAIKE